MTATFSHVRLIGFAIPTTPAEVVGVGDVTGSGAVAGTYRAYEGLQDDIDARLEVLESAVKIAFSQISGQAAGGVLNIFVVPEFYWHGTLGPYVFGTGEEDPAELILAQLQQRFPATDYPDTLFVFGSVISAQVDDLAAVLQDSSVQVRNQVVKSLGEGWIASTGAIQGLIFDMLINFVKQGHSYPKVEVRNRALVVGSERLSGVLGGFSSTSLMTEKYFASNEDFLLWDVTGKQVITEQSVAYPALDLSGGDLKVSANDAKAIFDVADGSATVAVEICLDHADHRLRRSVARSPWPTGKDHVGLHLIPSCGMQLHTASIAAGAGGLAFNCDGLYGLDGGISGEATTGSPAGVDSIHVSYIDGKNTTYGAHTQLTRVVKAAVGGDSAAPGAADAQFLAPQVDVTVLPVPRTDTTDAVFAGGPGAVHIYGLGTPLEL